MSLRFNQYITGNVKNVFGGAETLSVSSSLGTKTRSATEVSLRTPLVASPLHSLSLTGFSLDRDNTTFASHWEGLKGGRLSYEVGLKLLVRQFIVVD